MTNDAPGKRFRLVDLLKPHSKLLVIGFLAVIGEGAANLLEPWPLKLVLDNVLKSKPLAGLAEYLDRRLAWNGQTRHPEVRCARCVVHRDRGGGLFLRGKIRHHQRWSMGHA